MLAALRARFLGRGGSWEDKEILPVAWCHFMVWRNFIAIDVYVRTPHNAWNLLRSHLRHNEVVDRIGVSIPRRRRVAPLGEPDRPMSPRRSRKL